MKFSLIALLTMLLIGDVQAVLPDFNNLPDQTRIGRGSSSYDSFGFCFYGPNVDAALVSYNPTVNIYPISAAHGGAGLEDIATNEIPKQLMPFLGYQTNGYPLVGMVEITDTTSNGVFGNLPHVFWAPTNVYDGTAFTTSTGWGATQHIEWISLGIHPDENSDGSPGGVGFANTESTNVAVTFSYAYNDWWNQLIFSWSNDFASGNKYVWSSTSGHPGAAGGLMKAIAFLRTRLDTNTWSASVDWSGSIVSTNQCVVGSVTKSGNTLSFPITLMRFAFGWSVPNGTITNDARNAFVVNSEYANSFNEILKVPNTPDGLYSVTMDFGPFTASGAQLRSGINWFTIYNGSLWSNKVEVLGCMYDRYGADRVTLAASHDASGQGAHGLNDQINYASQALSKFSSGDRGNALIASMSPYTADVDALDDYGHNAAQRVARTVTITATEKITGKKYDYSDSK